MKTTKLVTCGIMLASIFGQNLAMAYDSQRFNQISPQVQHLRSMIEERIENVSEYAALKLSYRLYKVAFKAFAKLEKMSSEEFSAKLNQAGQQNTTPAAGDEDSLVQEELQDILPTPREMQNLSTTAAPSAPTHLIRHAEVTESIRGFLNKIGYRENAKGEKQPLNRAQFKERVLQYGSIEKSKQDRSIASNDIKTVLKTLFWTAVVCASVGLIAIYGWIGLGIALGAVAAGFLIFGIVAIIALNNSNNF